MNRLLTQSWICLAVGLMMATLAAAEPVTPATPATSGTAPATPPADGPKTYAPINPRALTAAANDMALAPSEVFQPVIQEGELLEFTITVSPTGMVAGSNLLQVPKVRPLAGDPNAMVYEITSRIRSSRLFDMIYKVKIDINSLMDRQQGFSQFYSYQALEGSSQRSERIEMDYSGDQAKAYYYRAEDTSNAHRETKRTVALPGRVQDPLCALYALRGAKMEVGTDILMTVTTEERNYPLLIKVLKIEEIEVANLGKRKCYRMEPVMRFGGLFTRKGKLWFWVDQETHVPVRLEVEIPVGKAFATLTRYENSPFDKPAAAAKPAPSAAAPNPPNVPAAPAAPVAPPAAP